MSSTPSSSSPWNSRSLLYLWLSSLRLRLLRVRWVRLWQSLLKKILPSVLEPTRKQDRPSSPEWESCTLRLSQTVSFVSLRQRQTLVLPRLLTKRLSQSLLMWKESTFTSPVVPVCTDTVRLSSSLWIRMEKSSSSSSLPLWVDLFLRNTSLQSRRVFVKRLTPEYLQDSLYWVLMPTFTTDLTTRSTLTSVPSSLPDLLPSRTLCRRLIQSFQSLS